ncbi:LysM peptidoglycan-binding domain-containing protein [Sutcliffiella horikoshii]|uniref:LysM peptidoglycan-binding domain-containing protein n=1 Tax=Sutcliffiella horikoshii TaxID=79883 RepID=A0AA94WT16_9BACI|nr:M14 family metallopeptidase [Sutcliffiella horikoshii]TYS59296.1 LysM peptidoglycan-binding domain-containing protein [Sutcliffiella horikoshii]
MKVYARRGDSLWYYSQLFGLPLNLICDSNPEVASSSELLKAGEEIVLPGFINRDYEVQALETIHTIAQKINISTDCMMLLNQGKDPGRLKPGDVLTVPLRITQNIVNPRKPYNYQTLIKDIERLMEVYPFIQCTSIGQSVMGKPLHHIRLGKGKKKIHWNGSFHANEWITSAVIMNLINDYLRCLTNYTPLRGIPCIPLYEQAELSIVPMVNPDGVDLVLNGPPSESPFKELVENINQDRLDYLGWKANIRGIDLNKHFPANWKIEKTRKEGKVPSPRDYPGDLPLTEPEALAMTGLADKENFDKVIAVHTQGEEFYWGYEGLEPVESEAIAEEFERVSTYKSVRYVDSHAGFKDWFIQEYKKPGFTLELGRGINPLPLSQYDTIYQKTLGIFLASLYI